MKLHTLKPAKGSVKNKKRIARGQGSGGGGTATRGHKGAKSRSGYSKKLGFEGGQMPLQRRVPKFGFKNHNRVAYRAINLEEIVKVAEKIGSTEITPEVLIDNGLLTKKDKVKILNTTELSAKIEVRAHAFSASAKSCIESAGGKAELI